MSAESPTIRRLLRKARRLQGSSAEQARADISLLVEVGLDTAERIIMFLRGGKFDDKTATVCCWALGQLGEAEASDALLSILRTAGNPELIWEAAKALRLTGRQGTASELVKILEADQVAERRSAAAYALGRFRSRSVVDSLIGVLKNKSEASEVRSNVAEVLGVMAAKAAVAALIDSLRDSSVDVRFWSAYALGELRDPAALDELERLRATDHAVPQGWCSISEEATESIERIRGAH